MFYSVWHAACMSRSLSLTDGNAMQVLHETQAKERSIEEELEKLLQQREQLEGMLLQLHSSTREVQLDSAACCFKGAR